MISSRRFLKCINTETELCIERSILNESDQHLLNLPGFCFEIIRITTKEDDTLYAYIEYIGSDPLTICYISKACEIEDKVSTYNFSNRIVICLSIDLKYCSYTTLKGYTQYFSSRMGGCFRNLATIFNLYSKCPELNSLKGQGGLFIKLVFQLAVQKKYLKLSYVVSLLAKKYESYTVFKQKKQDPKRLVLYYQTLGFELIDYDNYDDVLEKEYVPMRATVFNIINS